MSVIRATYQTFTLQLERFFRSLNLNNPLVLGAIAIISLMIGGLVSMLDMKMGIMIIGFILAIPAIYLCFTNLRFALIAILTVATLIPFIGKFISAPVGLALDGLLFLMIFSLIVNQTRERNWDFAKNPISYIILIWVFYNFALVLNPIAGSRMAWVYTVRTLALYNFLFFIAAYAMGTLKQAKLMIKAIIIMAFISCLYGLKQEFIGFSDAEMMWLYADEKRFQLIVQWGRFRIFSFFSDPTTYGILMAYMGTFCLALALGPFKMWQRISLAIAGVLMYAAMVYAGSRTPFVLVPAGIAFYTCVTMRKEILIGGALMLVLGTGAMMKSTSNPVIYRLQSAFRPTEDASVQVRLDNQARVQPFIQSHPIGAGLGSTGMWGERFTPDSWLASFAHDSSFVRFAVEAGYIGLFLFMLMLFVIMRMALYYYFRCYDPQIKTFYLGFATVIFMLGLASYPQEVIPIPPTSIIFFILLGAIVRFKDFDTRKPITDEQN
jgi:hypothetical protein